MRFSFKLDERKFRAMLHLHDYHNEKKIMIFWSDLTQYLFPSSQRVTKNHTPENEKEKDIPEVYGLGIMILKLPLSFVRFIIHLPTP